MFTYDAIVLNDYPNGQHYATWVSEGLKTLETRMKLYKFEGDIIICCGGTSATANAGKALCMVHWGKGRVMTDEDVEAAKIECSPRRIVYPLTNLRQFSRKFDFSKRRVSGAFQSIFQITLPDDVKIL